MDADDVSKEDSARKPNAMPARAKLRGQPGPICMMVSLGSRRMSDGLLAGDAAQCGDLLANRGKAGA
jgi:hypothetical protein